MVRKSVYALCAGMMIGWAGLAVAGLTDDDGGEVKQIQEVRLEMQVTPIKLVPERGNVVVEQPGSAFLDWEAGLRLMSVADQKLFSKFEVGQPVKITVVAPKGASVGTIVAAR
ncbi:MAG: hypothetical protein D6758_07815 [Gammaproteobacteria bacterium]|nr:MAG: hypothetical protein D6758_07815 [Gammaproteobacteria bacterium]